MGTLVACRLDILSMCKLVPSTVQQNGQFEAELCEVSKTPPSDELKKREDYQRLAVTNMHTTPCEKEHGTYDDFAKESPKNPVCLLLASIGHC